MNENDKLEDIINYLIESTLGKKPQRNSVECVLRRIDINSCNGCNSELLCEQQEAIYKTYLLYFESMCFVISRILNAKNKKQIERILRQVFPAKKGGDK